MSGGQEHGHEVLIRRLRGMGIPVEPLPGERAALCTLTLTGGPFATSEGSLTVAELQFATVGAGQIKCLAPDWLFALPLVSVLGCDDPEAIERAIRESWSRRLEALARAGTELSRSGVVAESESGGAVLAFALSSDAPAVRARMIEPGQAILPGVGPLAGVPLRRLEDRVAPVERIASSPMEIELGLTAHLEALAEAARQRKGREPAEPTPLPRVARRVHRVLLVGPQLLADQRLQEGLRVRGFDVLNTQTPNEAMRAFARQSFELVMVDARFGRDEGVDMIPALRSAAGVESVPVLLVDDRVRDSRREAARQAGAAGYLAHPIEPMKIAAGLDRLVNAPPRRRFSRYHRRLAVLSRTTDERAHCTAISRLGMFLCSEEDAAEGSVEQFEIALPEVAGTVHVEAETVFHRTSRAGTLGGRGLRFHAFQPGSEELLIRYLGLLEAEAEPEPE